MTLQVIQIVFAIGIVAAFAALQLGRVHAQDPRYLVTNLVASAGLAVTAVLTVQLGFVITNAIGCSCRRPDCWRCYGGAVSRHVATTELGDSVTALPVSADRKSASIVRAWPNASSRPSRGGRSPRMAAAKSSSSSR